MSIGEIFFRIVATLGGWIILSTHILLVLLVPRAVVEEDGALWLGTLVFGLVSIGAAVVVELGLRWRDIIRWITIPAALMLPFALWATLPYVTGTTFSGLGASAVHAGLETGPAATIAERAWAPVQIVALGAAGVQGIRVWLRPPAGAADESL